MHGGVPVLCSALLTCLHLYWAVYVWPHKPLQLFPAIMFIHLNWTLMIKAWLSFISAKKDKG